MLPFVEPDSDDSDSDKQSSSISTRFAEWVKADGFESCDESPCEDNIKFLGECRKRSRTQSRQEVKEKLLTISAIKQARQGTRCCVVSPCATRKRFFQFFVFAQSTSLLMFDTLCLALY